MTTFCSLCLSSMDGRSLLSRGSPDVHTAQWHPSVGTPIDVPDPSTSNRIAILV